MHSTELFSEYRKRREAAHGIAHAAHKMTWNYDALRGFAPESIAHIESLRKHIEFTAETIMRLAQQEWQSQQTQS